MNLLTIELLKLKRSKILLILLIPVLLTWSVSILNGDMSLTMGHANMSTAENFLIQSLLPFTWFMLPAISLITTLLLSQIEASQRALLKMLSLPIHPVKLAFSKFVLALSLIGVLLLLMAIAYAASAQFLTHTLEADFILDPLYVLRTFSMLWLLSIPMTAFYWALANAIKNPVISLGLGLATIAPIVFVINFPIWEFYPMGLPMAFITSEMVRLSEGYSIMADHHLWLIVSFATTLLFASLASLLFGKRSV